MANHLYIESNEDDVFICFTNPIDINYLNGVDFITDYDVYKNVSIDILEKIIENLTCRIKQLELRINNSTRYNEKIDKEYMLITHKACDISNIYLYRMNKINLYIPGEKYEPLLIKKIKHKIGRGKTDEKNSK